MKKLTGSIRKLLCFIVFAAMLSCLLPGTPAVHAEAEDRDLIVPEADTRYYTDEEISDMPLQVVNYAKNEIYARHGRLFASAELAGYFSRQPWYSGTITAADFTDQVFNDYERANIILLNDREMDLSGSGYALDQPGYRYDVVEDYIAARLGAVQEEAFLMRLRKIIGTVSLEDSEGEDLDVEENMRLFSESVLGTKDESGAIVDLDEEKLAILDEQSKAVLEKNDDGSRLVIRLRKGQLYFSVEEPLGEDEMFDITFSDLRLAIRGTSGVVTIEDEQEASVILASGQAMIYESGPEPETVQGTEIQAGERVRITSDEAGEKTFDRETLAEEDLPSFLTECLKQDPGAVPKVLEDTGWTGETFIVNDIQAALEQYRTILGRAGDYVYDAGGTATEGGYRYTLLQMQLDDIAPTLLLEKETPETDDWGYNALVFRYDPESRRVIQSDTILKDNQALWDDGMTRSHLQMEKDENGIQEWAVTGINGRAISAYRITADGSALKREEEWSGWINEIPAKLDGIDFEWHDISDMSDFDRWMPEETLPSGPDTAETEGQLPEDGGRIVFRGTLNEYSYDEVVAMWNEQTGINYPANDYERQLSPTYLLITLDEPQTMVVRAGDGFGSASEEVSMLGIEEPEKLRQYVGQHLIFSIDPERVHHANDVSLPSAPRVLDVRVFSESEGSFK